MRPGRPGSGPQPVGRGGAETRQWGASRAGCPRPPPGSGTYVKETQIQMLSAPLCDPKGNGLRTLLAAKARSLRAVL